MRESRSLRAKKPSETQENSGGQCSELREEIRRQKEYFAKEIETLQTNQAETREPQTSTHEARHSFGSTGSGADRLSRLVLDT